MKWPLKIIISYLPLCSYDVNNDNRTRLITKKVSLCIKTHFRFFFLFFSFYLFIFFFWRICPPTDEDGKIEDK